MISEPTLADLNVEIGEQRGIAIWPRVWATWFTEVWRAFLGFKTTYTSTLSKTWGAIGGGAEASQIVTVNGARSGDAVIVTPATKTAGIVDTIGVVTAVDTVTVYAQNTTGGSITPGLKTYRVIVFQQ